MRWTLLCRVVSILAVVIAAAGCDSGKDGPLPSSTAPTTVVATLKDDRPFLLMDVGPEAGAVGTLKTSAKETFLLRRAVWAVHQHGLKNPKFDGKDTFTVRQMRVFERDEYDRPVWGTATEVGVLELHRAKVAVVKGDEIDSMSEDELRRLFVSIQLSTKGL